MLNRHLFYVKKDFIIFTHHSVLRLLYTLLTRMEEFSWEVFLKETFEMYFSVLELGLPSHGQVEVLIV